MRVGHMSLTPFILIDGYQLPAEYNIEDIRFIAKDYFPNADTK